MQIYLFHLALVLASISAFALDARSETQQAPPKKLTLKVLVVDDRDQPVADVGVTTQAGTKFTSVSGTTNEQGRVSFELSPEQVAGLAIWADDGKNMGQSLLPWSRDEPTSLEPVTIQLTPARVMNVKVIDEAGESVEGATIIAQSNYRTGTRVATDTKGAATLRIPQKTTRQAIAAMKSGVGLDYFLFARPNSPKSDPGMLSQDHDDPIEMVLNGARQVAVEVVDQDGQALSGARVYPWLYRKPNKGDDLNLSGLNEFKLETNAQGRCSFEVPVDMDRATTVWVNLDGYASAERASYDPKSIDSTVRATLEKMVLLSGVVSLPNGVDGTDIKVTVAGDGYSMDGFRATAVDVQSDGAFEILVNRNMYYQLVAGDAKQWASPAVNAIVLDEDVSDVDLTLVPATRVYGRVTVEGSEDGVPNQYLQLYQRTANSYYDLPEEQKIPNPSESHFAISPIIVQSKQTDEQGKFEFLVGPGSYYMHGPRTAEMPKFDIEAETEKQLAISVKPVELKKDLIVPGRVVMADDTTKTVANASVFSYPLESFSGQHIRATTNLEGQFEAKQIMGPHYIHARANVDGQSYAGLGEITTDDEVYNVSISPVAKLLGRFIDGELNVPLEDREIRCAIEIKYPGGTSTSAFGGSATTDQEGNFDIDGLVVGRTYRLAVTIEVDAKGNARSWRYAGEVTPTSPGTFEQEFEGSAIDFPPTFAPVKP